MLNRAIHAQTLPKYLSSDHDPVYRFHQWQANLRVLEVKEIKTVPYVPLSHPFVERLIGTIRREYLDQTLFWTAADLEQKQLEVEKKKAELDKAKLQSALPRDLISGRQFEERQTALRRTQTDYDNYVTLFHCMTDFLRPPDMIVYLSASPDTLMERIAKRGRESEKTITRDYLARLGAAYDDWIARISQTREVHVIDTDKVPLQGPTPAFHELVDVLKRRYPPQVPMHLPGTEPAPPRR